MLYNPINERIIMRELIEKDRKITVVPSDFKCANKGVIVDVEPKYFTVELEYEPKGMLRHNYSEFYTQTNHGTLYFDSCPETIDGNRVKTYLKNSMYPLMYLFGKNSMPDVDNLLTSFYQLDDEARKEVVETIQFKLQYHRDPERAEQIKQIKG